MLKKYDERKMKNLGDIESLARSHTKTAIRVLAGIMREPTVQPMARVAAAKALLDRGWGKPKEMPKMLEGRCEKCGANLALVGVRHRCVERYGSQSPCSSPGAKSG